MVLISNDVGQNNKVVAKIVACQTQKFDRPVAASLDQIRKLIDYCTLNEGIQYLFDVFSGIVGSPVRKEGGGPVRQDRGGGKGAGGQ